MSNKSINTINTIKTAMGLAFLSSTLAAPVTALADNPFAAKDLSSGYQLASKGTEGKCGADQSEKPAEGKCGEGKCGEDKTAKDAEGKCGEGKCGEDKAAKDAEGKCGEGKCGEGKK